MKNKARDHDYDRLWNILIQTLESTIDLDENELDIDFSDALYGLLDATRNIIKDEEEAEACRNCQGVDLHLDESCPDCKRQA